MASSEQNELIKDALQEVTRNLYLLFGASYFTRDEFVRLDELINKGNYEWTKGPEQKPGNKMSSLDLQASTKPAQQSTMASESQLASSAPSFLKTSDYPAESLNAASMDLDKQTRISSWASEVNSPEAAFSTPSTTRAMPPIPPVDPRMPKGPIILAERFKDNKLWSNSAPAAPRPRRNEEHIALREQFAGPVRRKNKSFILIHVRPGDRILILKPKLNGVYWALNRDSQERGFIRENIFGKGQDAFVLEHQPTMAQAHVLKPQQQRLIPKSVDDFENSNAADWDEVSPKARRARITEVLAPKPNHPGGNSKFAVLPQEENSSFGEELEVNPSVDQEVFSESQSPKDPTVSPGPKLLTCWYWKTPNRECRYTAEECGYLHEWTADSELSLRNGKPSWGARPDSANLSPEPPSPDKKEKKTCYYWSTNGKCSWSEKDCKYLHAESPAGVATAPGKWKAPGKWNGSETASFGTSNGLVTPATADSGGNLESTVQTGWESTEGDAEAEKGLGVADETEATLTPLW